MAVRWSQPRSSGVILSHTSRPCTRTHADEAKRRRFKHAQPLMLLILVQGSESLAGCSRCADNAMLAKVLDATAAALLLVDDQGVITLVNARALQLFGFERQELLGQSVDMLVPARYRGTHAALRQTFMRCPQARAMGAGRDLFACTKTGVELPVEIGLNPMEDTTGCRCVLATIVDISERKRLEAQREAVTEQLRLVVEAAPNGIVVVNSAGIITRVNAQTEKLFGYDRGYLSGKELEMLLPVRFRAAHPAMRATFLAHPRARAMGAGRDLFALHADGHEFPVEIGLRPVPTPDGMQVVASIVDITERKRLESMVVAQEALQATDRARSTFIATVSHEIRTPLNAVIGMATLLADTTLTDEQRSMIETIRIAGEGLASVINDVLDYSKIDAGRLLLETVAFRPDDVLADALRLLQHAADAKGITLTAEMTADVPWAVIGDPHRWKQVLLNVVGNAIKFTPRGSVLVRVSVEAPDHALAEATAGSTAGVARASSSDVSNTNDASDHDISFNVPAAGSAAGDVRSGEPAAGSGAAAAADIDVMLRCDVVDVGVGISPRSLGTIFQPFSQGDASTTRRHGGTGLGLAISKRLTQLHGGGIRVQSTSGVGSTFTFTIRVRVPHRDPDLALDSWTVVIGSENRNLRSDTASQLRRCGAIAVEVETTREAMAAVTRAAPTLALIDAALLPSDASPFLASWFREVPGSAKLCILGGSLGLCSGVPRAEDVTVLPLPLRAPALIELAFSGKLLPVVTGGGHSPVHTAPGAGPRLGGRVLVVDDNAVNQRLAAGLLKKLGCEAVLADNGAQAVEASADPNIDAVLMDCEMPVMDGYAATAAIRQREAARATSAEAGPSRAGAVFSAASGAAAEHADAAALAASSTPTHPSPVVAAVGITTVSPPTTPAKGSGTPAPSTAAPRAPRRHLPIIAMTASAMLGDRERCLRAGMDGYLAKPVHIRDLVAALSPWLSTTVTPTAGTLMTPPAPERRPPTEAATAAAITEVTGVQEAEQPAQLAQPAGEHQPHD